MRARPLVKQHFVDVQVVLHTFNDCMLLTNLSTCCCFLLLRSAVTFRHQFQVSMTVTAHAAQKQWRACIQLCVHTLYTLRSKLQLATVLGRLALGIFGWWLPAMNADVDHLVKQMHVFAV
jgi:hypothetical protein